MIHNVHTSSTVYKDVTSIYIYMVTCWLHLYFFETCTIAIFPHPCRLPHPRQLTFPPPPRPFLHSLSRPCSPARTWLRSLWCVDLWGTKCYMDSYMDIYVHISIHMYIYIYIHIAIVTIVCYAGIRFTYVPIILECSNSMEADEFRLGNSSNSKGRIFPVATIIRTEVLAHENILGLSAMG